MREVEVGQVCGEVYGEQSESLLQGSVVPTGSFKLRATRAARPRRDNGDPPSFRGESTIMVRLVQPSLASRCRGRLSSDRLAKASVL
jgi:hypothetical protein